MATPPEPLYRPLLSSSHEIRLVTLHPSPTFDLPYVWGPESNPSAQKPITLNSHPFLIKPSLESALRHLRLPTTPRTLWIDALCINQSNIPERSAQVQLMRFIFTLCTTNLVWLGPDKPRSPLQHGLRVLERLTTDKGFICSRAHGDGYRLELHEAWNLTAVFKWAEVWQRVWIMQELACAPRVVIVGGHATLDWSVLSSFLGRKSMGPADAFHEPFSHGDGVWRRDKGLFLNPAVVEHQREVVQGLQLGKVGNEASLLDVLARLKWTKATDPRDKVYGLLGLVSETHGIVVDYGLTVKEVFMGVAERLVNLAGNLDLLCQAPWQLFGNKMRVEGLPSWVPDFAAAGSPELLFAQRGIFDAGRRGHGFNVPCEVVAVGKGTKALCLDGGIWLGDVLKPVPSPKTDMDAFVERVGLGGMISAEGDGDASSVYPATAEPRMQAHCRTVWADCKGYPIRRLTADEIRTYTASLCKAIQDDGVDIPALAKLPDNLDNKVMLDRMRNWRFAVTDSGLFALVPKYAEEGDRVVVVPGSKPPLVVRRAGIEVDCGNDGEVVPGKRPIMPSAIITMPRTAIMSSIIVLERNLTFDSGQVVAAGDEAVGATFSGVNISHNYQDRIDPGGQTLTQRFMSLAIHGFVFTYLHVKLPRKTSIERVMFMHLSNHEETVPCPDNGFKT
ncbi:heterokaryon incompatibility protein-domain-containing protein [Cercophora scortea]|uniref:Heterokaryon incompatibility protein-domain-containing protein n=1 Tax=Cercophora scortea TaxID=314031 RepID=A0AAE0IWH9_9PEZI|nr:heterokaryon incompatibility protein-domain-containing protein [Cercophora scortea]